MNRTLRNIIFLVGAVICLSGCSLLIKYLLILGA
jgi:hypothetical protein